MSARSSLLRDLSCEQPSFEWLVQKCRLALLEILQSPETSQFHRESRSEPCLQCLCRFRTTEPTAAPMAFATCPPVRSNQAHFSRDAGSLLGGPARRGSARSSNCRRIAPGNVGVVRPMLREGAGWTGERRRLLRVCSRATCVVQPDRKCTSPVGPRSAPPRAPPLCTNDRAPSWLKRI